MFIKDLKSIRQFSLSYVSLNNLQKLTRSPLKQTVSISYHQAQQCTFCHRSDWTLNSQETLVNKKFYIISNRLSSQLISGLQNMLNYLPFFVSGEIVSGFGRGSKELGIPTANYPLEVVKSLPDCFNTGIYYGWANVDNGPVYKMVMSIGWNPFFDNKEKSMETHILHNYNRDLYGCLLKICIVGFLRPEENFNSLEELVAAIKSDIQNAENELDNDESYKQLQHHKFFHESDSKK